ncbi:MAG TPA: hypothetical protein VE441_11545 [Mycobacterium sp.]|nr:hypothetical protein [Mycobacterium sp.]
MTRRTRSIRHAVTVVAATGIALLTSCGSSPRLHSADGSNPGFPTPQLTSRVVAGHCDGQIGAHSVDGDVTVEDGGICELLGTRVEGNVSVGHSARLYVSGVDVDGDIEGERARAVEVTHGSRVGGNVQLESGNVVVIADSHIHGDLSLQHQHGKLLIRDNTVSGNAEIEDNTGGAIVSHNVIHGDLSCQDNTRSPAGGDNAVAGDRTDQCHAL